MDFELENSFIGGGFGELINLINKYIYLTIENRDVNLNNGVVGLIKCAAKNSGYNGGGGKASKHVPVTRTPAMFPKTQFICHFLRPHPSPPLL